MIPALIPSWSAWAPSVAETWVSLISLRLIGRAPICSVVASSWASPCSPLKPPEIWAPLRPSIPSGFSLKLMIGRGLDFVVEDDGEVAGEGGGLFGADRADRLRLAALGDLAGDFVEGACAGAGEVEGDVRFAAVRVFLLRVGDVVARERRVVFQREPAGLGGFVELAACSSVGQFGDQDRAGRDFDRRSPSFGSFSPVGLTKRSFSVELGPGQQLVRLVFSKR